MLHIWVPGVVDGPGFAHGPKGCDDACQAGRAKRLYSGPTSRKVARPRWATSLRSEVAVELERVPLQDLSNWRPLAEGFQASGEDGEVRQVREVLGQMGATFVDVAKNEVPIVAGSMRRGAGPIGSPERSACWLVPSNRDSVKD